MSKIVILGSGISGFVPLTGFIPKGITPVMYDNNAYNGKLPRKD